MKVELHDTTLELVQGDITEQDTDAIVNAANSRLAGGGGVDGAIHRAGGPTIMEETRRGYPNGCPTGGAVITRGGRLTARHVIHAVGPVYDDGKSGEPEKLASAYRRSLEVAVAHSLRRVAFPSLSTGAYGYPIDEAATIALRTAIEFVGAHRGKLDLIRFVLFDHSALQAFQTALTRLYAANR
jgi:O-acetyl-ADP-ribose deacetylase (regulator of RNase III)